MAANLLEREHDRQASAGNFGPCQPDLQHNPGRRHPMHGPGPLLSGRPLVHRPRPYFYVQPMQPPPPPPLYHYQWPMPMPYDPYSGVPGLGYSMPGMVMPPFPLHPYMEVPGYVLPHAQLHPTEYRQYQFPPAAMAYQNNSRSGVFYQNPTPRQMATTEVQTEPLPDTSSRPTSVNSLGGTDSGRGTNTPSSTSSYAEKPRCPEKECSSPLSSETGMQGLEKVQVAGTDVPVDVTTVHSRRNSDVLGKTVHGGSLVHRDVWSVCSTDVMVPMCSSSEQEDEVMMTDRRVSSSTDVLMDRESTSKVERTPECGQTRTHKITHEESTVVQTERSGLESVLSVINDLAPDLKTNESVWSVESLPAYVPSIDWMIQNGLMDAEAGERKLSEKVSENASDHADQSQMSFHFTQLPKKLNASVWSVQSLDPYIPSEVILKENDRKEPESIIENESEVDISRGFSASQILAITERRRSQRFSLTLENGEAERMSEDTVLDEQSFRFSQVSKKLNESVWSVQSIDPYIPSRDWFIQNGILDPEKEYSTHVSQGLTASQVLAVTERRKSQRLSLSSVDSNASHISSSSWLADLGNVFYYGKLPLGSQENGNVDIPENGTQSSTCLPEEPELHFSECLEGGNRLGDDCPVPHDTGSESAKAPAKQPELLVPNKHDCELISNVSMQMDSSPNRNLKTCGPMCLKQMNCLCEEPMLNTVSYKKSPIGNTEGSVAKIPPDHRFQEQQHRTARQKWQIDSRRERKARLNNESCENGYGMTNYSKNLRHWQSRPLKAQAQTNPSNKPFGQGTGDDEPWYGNARARKTRGANGRRKY